MANVMNPTTDERPEIVHLSNSERWMMFIGVWMALVASILAVMWRGLIWLIVGERAILLGSIGLLFSWVVQNRPPSRRLVNAFIVSALLVFFCLDMYIALGLMPHIAWLYMRQLFISLSTADALALGLSLIVTLYALRCFEIWDTVDAQLSLILGLAVFVLLLPVERSMWLLAFFAPYAIGALIVMLTSQNARIRACTSMIHISNWEQRMRRSFWHTVRDVGAWVLVVATLLSYFMTSFTRPTDWAARFQIELAERLARWLTRERAVITTYTFSVSLWRLPTGFSDTVVMRVTSNVPGYWRTCVFDYYSKGEWKHRLPWYKRYVRGETVINLPPTDDRVDARIKFIKVTQTVYFEQHFSGYLPALAEPRRIDVEATRIYVDPAGSVKRMRAIQAGLSYTVWSRVKLWNERLMTSTSISQDDKQRLSPYLQLPDELPHEVLELAYELTFESQTLWEKVKAIRRYLSGNFTYTERPPMPPLAEDPIAYFLLRSKRGLCVHFASAMVLLCRAVGIPARLAVGYATGEFDPRNREFIVRERDAHAWAEVYIPPVGWISVEPSPGFAIPSPRRLWLPRQIAKSNWWQDVKDALTAFWQRYDVLISIVAIALVLLGFATYVVIHTPALRRWWNRTRAPVTIAEPIAVRMFNHATRMIARRYRPRMRSETALEYASAARHALPQDAYEIFVQMAQQFTQVVYGRQDADAIWCSEMRMLLHRLRRALRQRQRHAKIREERIGS